MTPMTSILVNLSLLTAKKMARMVKFQANENSFGAKKNTGKIKI